MNNYLTVEEAAEKLGYGYHNLLRLIREGRIEKAQWWQGYLIPSDITTEDIRSLKRGRPKNL